MDHARHIDPLADVSLQLNALRRDHVHHCVAAFILQAVGRPPVDADIRSHELTRPAPARSVALGYGEAGARPVGGRTGSAAAARVLLVEPAEAPRFRSRREWMRV